MRSQFRQIMISWQLILFSFIFVVTAGISVMGGLLSLTMFRKAPTRLHQLMIYQQLFIYAFLMYGIWGNLALMELTGNWQVPELLRNRILTVYPLLGLPFLLAAWYMLMQVFGEMTGKKWSKPVSWIYFSACAFALPAIFLTAVRQGWLSEERSSLLVYGALVSMNAVIHLYLISMVLLNLRTVAGKNRTGFPLILLFYFIGVAVLTTGTFLAGGRHFLFALFTILAAFMTNLLLPLYVRTKEISVFAPGLEVPENFEDFCLKFEISRREAEIIRELRSGKSNQEIADTLFITLQTVKDHIHRIFTKTGVSNRVQLINLTQRRLL